MAEITAIGKAIEAPIKVRSDPELWAVTFCPSTEILAVAMAPDMASFIGLAVEEGAVILVTPILADGRFDSATGAAIIEEAKSKVAAMIKVNFILIVLYCLE